MLIYTMFSFLIDEAAVQSLLTSDRTHIADRAAHVKNQLETWYTWNTPNSSCV